MRILRPIFCAIVLMVSIATGQTAPVHVAQPGMAGIIHDSMIVSTSESKQTTPVNTVVSGGWVTIDVSPIDARLIVDSVDLGKGDRKMQLTKGRHIIIATCEGISKRDTIVINDGDEVELRIELHRPRDFHWGFSFDGAMACGNGPVYGWRHSVGFYKGRYYYGIEYTWGVYSSNYSNRLYGGGASYGISIFENDFVAVRPMLSMGFWQERGVGVNNYLSYEQFYIGGPQIGCSFGGKNVYGNIVAGALLGFTGMRPMVNVGVGFKF